MFGLIRKEVQYKGGVYHEYAEYPLAEAATPNEIREWDGWPDISHWDFSFLSDKIDRINKKTRYHIRYPFFELGGIFELSWGLYGMENFLIDLIDKPELPCAIMDKYTELFISIADKALKKASDKIDVVYTYDDIGMQNNLLMSRDMWKKYILPRHKRLNKVIKKYSVPIMYHSCGAVYDIIPDLIEEMGINILNPLQPRAKGMNLEKIKNNFGDQIGFHGGIDLQETLPYGSRKDVRREVRSRCKVLGQGAGYICAPAHHIQADTPVENIIEMYTTERKV